MFGCRSSTISIVISLITRPGKRRGRRYGSIPVSSLKANMPTVSWSSLCSRPDSCTGSTTVLASPVTCTGATTSGPPTARLPTRRDPTAGRPICLQAIPGSCIPAQTGRWTPSASKPCGMASQTARCSRRWKRSMRPQRRNWPADLFRNSIAITQMSGPSGSHGVNCSRNSAKPSRKK